ncbi:5-formyltetrahydrofolate cyclo-ligase [Butyrivibrio sp. INlla14]|uniref:5-formyltetrahydrofolate cyclo-ligase n=1 Tax=Butyrivibrio sp. INlla14 TaxID=1520808 RepID=UPI0008775142|nr:5-formyltetrahydrofolate cyclo-ligase [Butyrivibrio sp. INlla14]SCY30700.1 5-formyltetrahydrofolate cyclo-ligase [Butyrivibrio sp. INlla14]
MTRICYDKKSIRKKMIKDRDRLSTQELSEKTKLIQERLFSSEEYKKALNILIYASMGSEVITDGIIKNALESGKNVFCPKVTDRAKREMAFVKITSLSDLKSGYMGIREPEISETSVIFCADAFSHSLVIMPGVSFDRDRNRLGYGGGFYDTFLSQNAGISTIALAFDCQIYDGSFPDEIIDEHDIKPDKIITESKKLYFF